MNRIRRTAWIAVLLTIITGLVAWAVYTTFITGTTSGPDFISAVQSGHVDTDTIISVEVVDPAVGYTPFTVEDLASLARRTEIDSPLAISRLLTLLRNARPGWAPRNPNHPGTSHQAYLKVNAKNGFYWLYCRVLRDANGPWFSFEANTLNATNPNGTSRYYLESSSDVLAIIQHDNKQNGAANWSQPIRYETNTTSASAGSRR